MSLSPPNPNVFANSPLDRAAHHRRDEDWLKAALANADARLMIFRKGQPFVDDAGVIWLGGHAREILGGGAQTLFLGLDERQAPHFAVAVSERFDIEDGPLAGLGRFEDMRPTAQRIDAADAAVIGVACAVFEWHRRNGFCANCAEPSRVEEAGWRRKCDGCGLEHYPRVDPVVIMLPVKGEKCALGRSARFPGKMHSALAGFVEPGESIEEAVARETLEETGLKVSHVRYHSTQPWPFPHTLMIGAIAEVSNEDINVDPFELESARWFTREETRLLLAGEHPDANCPPPFAIAHQLIKSWTEEG
ncbi:MAG: NAD(+) diphosphatase [Hyphomonadaceae bacterium]